MPSKIAFRPSPPLRPWLALAAALAVAGCAQGPFDLDMRPRDGAALSTTERAMNPSPTRPLPDARGIISYPGYQVVVAGRAETVAAIAERLGLAPEALASANAIGTDVRLQGGEILVLPDRVAPEDGASQAGSIASTSLPAPADVSLAAPTGPEAERPAPAGATATDATPLRHKVERGETAWSIARLYDVNVRTLAEWNGLDSEYRLRQGQILLIPPASGATPPPTAVSRPGQGSVTPVPPSAERALPSSGQSTSGQTASRPAEKPATAPAAPTARVPDLGAARTEASGARFVMPAEGRISRPYEKGKNEGIGIAATAGSPVRAAAEGTVAAITRDTEQVPIIVLRHADNMLTVYANVEGIAVDKDQRVSRGQTIAAVRAGSPAFLHFEVRRGFDSVDPMPYLQ